MSCDIESLQNPQIKHLQKLRENRERKRSGQTRIDGGRELLRAMQAGSRPETIYHCPERLRGDDAIAAITMATELGMMQLTISEAVYEKVRYGDRDEGLCATIRWSPGDWSSLAVAKDSSLFLVVEGIEKPGNLGALLRTADAVGVDAVVCVDPACEVDGPNVIRASMGTLFCLDVFVGDLEKVLQWLSESELQVVVTRPQASVPYYELDYRGATAIVMGAEHEGLRSDWDTLEAKAVHLPMNGVSDSLNLSVATGVLLYEALRQRSG
jgi:RNA methyltransferase, TrmH family